MSRAPATRCGFVALLGAPNAGKSTLLNSLVGAKVAIVTPKAQTTRTRLRAIAIVEQTQIVFVDTPGIFTPKRRLDRAMVASAWGEVSEADRLVLVADAAVRQPDADTAKILHGLADSGRQPILALNKIDKIKRSRLLEQTVRLGEATQFEQVYMISALTGDGVADLLGDLAKAMPEGPWLYPEDQLLDLPERLFAAELTREKLFLRLHDELPYALTVETESWRTLKDGSVRIEQTVYVRRPSQKAIALGKGGQAIKAVREAAQAELAEHLGTPVHLFLFVKVREHWQDDPARYRTWGLDFEA